MKKFLFALAIALGASASFAGSLICRLSDPSLASEVGLTYGITPTDNTSPAPFVLFTTPAGTSTTTYQLLMATDPRVVWAEDDASLTTPESAGQAKLPSKGSTLPAVGDRIKVTNLNFNFLQSISWNRIVANTSGRLVKVAILDTGLTPNAPYLTSKVVASINTVEPGLPAFDMPRGVDSDRDGRFDSKVGHGSMVAGIVDLVSPQSRFVICRVADSDGIATAWRLIKGLAFAVVNGAEVANVSLASTERIVALSDVLDWVKDYDITIVAAAGNLGTESDMYPAGYTSVISVAGLNTNRTKAPFSNYSRSIVSSAPAVGIVSIDWNGSAAAWSGTSFAAPIITGSIVEGLRLTSGPIKAARILKAVKSTGDDIDRLNPAYEKMLGTELNFTRLIEAFRTGNI